MGRPKPALVFWQIVPSNVIFVKHAHLPSDPLSCPWRLGLELIGYRGVEKVYGRFPLSRAANPLSFHSGSGARTFLGVCVRAPVLFSLPWWCCPAVLRLVVVNFLYVNLVNSWTTWTTWACTCLVYNLFTVLPELPLRRGRELPHRDLRGVVFYPNYQEAVNFEYKVDP